jgi:nucleoside-diphosphate-sugar epimerase
MSLEHCLITGASGFIGRRLAETLSASGRRVTCLVRPTSNVECLESLPVRIHRGDVTTGEGLDVALDGVDVVYHLAGSIRAHRYADFYRVNAEGVRSALEACCRRAIPPTFVHVSSIAAAGPSIGGIPRREVDPPQPVSEYGRSKLAGEIVARSFASRVPITIVRPAIVFGPGDLFTLSWFKTIARFAIHPIPAQRDARFSLIHIDDLVSLLFAAAERGDRLPHDSATHTAGTGIYFAGSQVDVTYRQIGELIALSLGRRAPLMPVVPRPVLWGYALLGEAVGRMCGKPPWIGFDKCREACAGSWTCAAESALRLGISFPESLTERFRETAEGYRRLGFL